MVFQILCWFRGEMILSLIIPTKERKQTTQIFRKNEEQRGNFGEMWGNDNKEFSLECALLRTPDPLVMWLEMLCCCATYLQMNIKLAFRSVCLSCVVLKDFC